MATPNPPLDTVITVKVNYEGVTRRAKMALRDTAPRILEQEVRNFLHIPAESSITLERYSDSAAAYVLLEPNNGAVYKQLYRAAKAKSKLKLRVSLKPQETPAFPKPITVEDLLQAAPSAQITTKPLVPVPSSDSASSTMSRTYDRNTLTAAAKLCESDMFRRGHSSPENAPLADTTGSSSSSPQEWAEMATKDTAPAGQPVFAICCNSCGKTTPSVHYHCSTCDDGDFDLCENCVGKGISCYGSDHWLIKRAQVNGQILNSTTEKIPPKPKPTQPDPKKEEAAAAAPAFDAKSALASLQESLAKLEIQTAARVGRLSMRTCNQCIQEFPEAEFLHCETCEDYDLCSGCFSKDGHGHHPEHAFSPAVDGATFSERINSKLAPGRNKAHGAICDSCDKYITGIRHKCVDCPDWDYCAGCVPNASTTHPGHRFVPVYNALKSNYNLDYAARQQIHVGICCDGPLCSTGKTYPSYIRGVRYKCAVCHDMDFCATCEANPSNTHNKTHPLIKFNSPVRHVSVTTHGEQANGQQMPAMGDHAQRAPETVQTSPHPPSKLSMNAPRTVVDTKPQSASPKSSLTAGLEKEKEKKKSEESRQETQDMRATFLRDTVQDGTIFTIDEAFEQTWVLRNDGRDTWPVGSAVRFVGGDYMGCMSSRNAASSTALATASVTNATTKPVGPGDEWAFTAKLLAPPRAGKSISFWRLASPSGHMFGHRLWCDINVRVMKSSASSSVASPAHTKAAIESGSKVEETEASEEAVKTEPVAEGPKVNTSQMIFPRLEKESPAASIHQHQPHVAPAQTDEKPTIEDEFEDCSKDSEWDGSDDDFLTDEEYDILDASDEEFPEDHTKKASS